MYHSFSLEDISPYEQLQLRRYSKSAAADPMAQQFHERSLRNMEGQTICPVWMQTISKIYLLRPSDQTKHRWQQLQKATADTTKICHPIYQISNKYSAFFRGW